MGWGMFKGILINLCDVFFLRGGGGVGGEGLESGFVLH